MATISSTMTATADYRWM